MGPGTGLFTAGYVGMRNNREYLMPKAHAIQPPWQGVDRLGIKLQDKDQARKKVMGLEYH